MIDGVPYLDGGVTDSVPIRRAAALGNHKIIAVLTRDAEYEKEPLKKWNTAVYRHLYHKYPKLIEAVRSRYIRYNRTTELIDRLVRTGKIFVIRPECELIGRAEKDYDKLMAFYQHVLTGGVWIGIREIAVIVFRVLEDRELADRLDQLFNIREMPHVALVPTVA